MASRLALVLTLALTVCAQYDTFYFSSSKTGYECDKVDFQCPAPSICSHDSTVNKYYCCIPGSTSNVCWTGSTACSGKNDTTAGSGQLDCGSFCCLSGREECTQRTGQINICWATQTNPVENLTDMQMNNTFSSLSSAKPSATRFSVQLAQLTAASTSTSSSSTSSTSPTPSSSSPTPNFGFSSTHRLSGGAIAGIALGSLAGLILVALIIRAIVLRTRRSRTQSDPHEPNVAPTTPTRTYAPVPPIEMSDGSRPEYYTPKAALQSPGQYTDRPVELYSDTSTTHSHLPQNAPVELDGRPQHRI